MQYPDISSLNRVQPRNHSQRNAVKRDNVSPTLALHCVNVRTVNRSVSQLAFYNKKPPYNNKVATITYYVYRQHNNPSYHLENVSELCDKLIPDLHN